MALIPSRANVGLLLPDIARTDKSRTQLQVLPLSGFSTHAAVTRSAARLEALYAVLIGSLASLRFIVLTAAAFMVLV